MPEVITDNLDLWTSALLTKSTAGRGSNGKLEAYGIKKLRELILELAVRGKLVPQDPTDEPASVLLRKIAGERDRLAKEGKIKKPKELPEIKDDEKPFALPNSWEYVRLNDVGEWGAGATPLRSRQDYYGGDIPWFKSGELVEDYISESEEHVTEWALKETSLRSNNPGDVLIAMYGATIGKTSILRVAATTNQAVCACTPFTGFANVFLLTLLKAYKSRFVGQGAGGAQPNISREKIIATVIALPPTDEQHRIVAKVDELMALCDQLEQQQTDSLVAHQTLVGTLLGTLTRVESQQEFSAAWARIASHFETLFTTEASIDQLKQTILQLAVMGRLVPQDPIDEPARELLKCIQAEKVKLTADGKIKKGRPLPDIGDNEKPFELSVGWEWARLDVITSKITDGEHISPQKTETGMKLLTAKHVLDDGITLEDPQYVSLDDGIRFRERCDPQTGDLLICSRGTIGRCCAIEVTEDFCLMGSVILVRAFPQIDPRYLDCFLKSEAGQFFIRGATKGMAVNALYLKDIRLCPVPVPPSNEQHRIVAKVNELMTICDALKARLSEAQTTQAQLADAIVEQAVA